MREVVIYPKNPWKLCFLICSKKITKTFRGLMSSLPLVSKVIQCYEKDTKTQQNQQHPENRLICSESNFLAQKTYRCLRTFRKNDMHTLVGHFSTSMHRPKKL